MTAVPHPPKVVPRGGISRQHCSVTSADSKKAQWGWVPRLDVTHTEGASGNSTRRPGRKYHALRSQTKPSQKLRQLRCLPGDQQLTPFKDDQEGNKQRDERPEGSQPACQACRLTGSAEEVGRGAGCYLTSNYQHELTCDTLERPRCL